MLLHIADVLTPQEAAAQLAALERLGWGHRAFEAATQANGFQLPDDHPLAQELGSRIVSVLERNPLFMGAALPQRVFPPLFYRYTLGQEVGTRVDCAVRQVTGTSHRVRTDLSATIFLTEPEEYDGGELLIEDRYGTQSVKLPAGHMILYPSTSLHRVQPVTRGSVTTSFFWIQSMIRDDGQRSLLFDLDMAIQKISGENPDHAAAVQLTGVYHNLIRMWAEV